MEALLRLIDAWIGFLGKAVAWLLFGVVLVTTTVVIMQLFGENSIAMQESVTYMHAAVFMIGAAYTLQMDGHVRVDVFYRTFSPRKKAVVNIIGALLFLFPVAGIILYFSWGDVMRSWSVLETSNQPGGLPYIYILKSLMPTFSVLLILQGLAEVLRNILILQGKVVLPEEAE